MHNDFNLYAVQKALGYTFKDDMLVKTAFTHRSHDVRGEETNTSLTILGEKLTDFILCDHITARSPLLSEKELINQCAELRSALNIERFINENGLAQFIRLSKINEPMRNGAVMAKELFFAICAAIYKDGGLPAFKSFIKPMLKNSGEHEHYRPKNDGQILINDEQTGDGATHIKNERLFRPHKNASVSITKAQTVHNTSVNAKPEARSEDAPTEKKKEKKDRSLTSLLRSKKKADDAKSVQTDNDEYQIGASEAVQGNDKKSFIRDPFAPVKLSDDLRNFKSKKERAQFLAAQGEKRAAQEENREKAKTEADTAGDDSNYKSLLQEYIQKNVRTSNVPIKYASAAKDGMWKCEITVDGQTFAKGVGMNKKDAEKNAAKNGYLALSDKKSSERKLIASLSGADSEADISAPSVDYISKLNQHFQKKDHLSEVPLMYTKKHSGKAGQYLVCLIYNDRELGQGRGQTYKEAKHHAAQDACEKLGI